MQSAAAWRKPFPRRLMQLFLAVLLLLSGSGCKWSDDKGAEPFVGEWRLDEAMIETDNASGGSNVYYEIFVRAFADSNGDGIGDLQGVIDMLDYLNDGDPDTTDDLGVSGIWLMPIHPSPSYHGYDVVDYYDVHPDYGTMDDFRELIEEAHRRGISVMIDFVANHTSSEHPWFQSASANPSDEFRDWYVWRDKDDPGSETSATGGPAWHKGPGIDEQYLGVFWGGMPDLNFHQSKVRDEMVRIGQFWLQQGVDGFRLDAAQHIFEDLNGDDRNGELQEQNIRWWRQFRESLQQINPDVYLAGEVWEASPSRIAPYYEAFDSVFNTPLIDLIKPAVQKESDSNLPFSLGRMHRAFQAAADRPVIDAPFLANHDHNRIISTLQGNSDQAKMAVSILLTLPGRPFLYYGEEIGMKGVKPDEEIREPMKWVDSEADGDDTSQAEKLAPRFSAADFRGAMTDWRRPRHQADTLSVLAQYNDPASLLHHYRALIQLRGKLPVLSDGSIVEASVGSPQAMAYERRGENDRLLVVHNLGQEALSLTIDSDSDGIPYNRLIALSKPGIQWNPSAADGTGQLVLPPYSTAVLR